MRWEICPSPRDVAASMLGHRIRRARGQRSKSCRDPRPPRRRQHHAPEDTPLRHAQRAARIDQLDIHLFERGRAFRYISGNAITLAATMPSKPALHDLDRERRKQELADRPAQAEDQQQKKPATVAAAPSAASITRRPRHGRLVHPHDPARHPDAEKKAQHRRDQPRFERNPKRAEIERADISISCSMHPSVGVLVRYRLF